MARQGLVLEPAGQLEPIVSRQTAIDRDISFYGLFTADDPVFVGFYRVTAPRAGRLSDPHNPNSPIVPLHRRQPMWVIHAKADMLKDDNDPGLGLVRGTVIVILTSRGMPIEARTY